MFLKNRMRASGSIHARIAFFASRAVTTDAECALAQKTMNAGKLVKNKDVLYFTLKNLVLWSRSETNGYAELINPCYGLRDASYE